MKKSFLAWFLIVVFLPGSVFGSPQAELKRIDRQVAKSVASFSDREPAAIADIQATFQRAMEFTQPKFKPWIRESALSIASKCLVQPLFPEVKVAIDTYLSMFPKGIHRKDVLVRKAFLDYWEGRFEDGEKALTDASLLVSDAGKPSFEYLQFSAFLAAKKYRTAEKFLADLDSRFPRTKTKRDLKRYAKGTEIVNKNLEKVRKGELDGFSASEALGKAVEQGYFSEGALEAEMLGMVKMDSVNPPVHGIDIRWMGTQRTTYHFLAPVQRMQKLSGFLADYPEGDPSLRGKAILELSCIYRHEMRDPDTARLFLDRLAEIPMYAETAKFEALLARTANGKITDPQTTDDLMALGQMKSLFPYDNGWLPEISLQEVKELTALSLLIQGRKADLGHFMNEFKSEAKLKNLPMQVLFLFGADKRDASYSEFQKVEGSLKARDRILLEEIIYPLYLPVKTADVLFMGALGASSRFPTESVDVLIKLLTGAERPTKVNHALALLSDLYQRERNYIEAQTVWNTLRNLYPRSIWVR